MIQHAAYAWFFQVEVYGVEHIPAQGGYIIVSNHTSHLDMGLIKHAMGPAGHGLVSLAAQDYFFSNPFSRWYFSNFTNLLPFNRTRGFKESLLAAGRVLEESKSLLIFPEGTRTRDGRMSAFKPTVGYLALNFGLGVLPVYLSGAFEALPKGKLVPRGRRLKVAFGPVIPAQNLRDLAAAAGGEDQNRLATKAVEDAVRSLEQKSSKLGLQSPGAYF